MDVHTKLFLKQLKRPIEVPVGKFIKLSLEEHIKGWKKQNENTGCEPTGLHFGHFKVGCEDIELAEFDWMMRKLPMEEGFPPRNVP